MERGEQEYEFKKETDRAVCGKRSYFHPARKINQERRCADEKESNCRGCRCIAACCLYDSEEERGQVSGGYKYGRLVPEPANAALAGGRSAKRKNGRQVKGCGNGIMWYLSG